MSNLAFKYRNGVLFLPIGCERALMKKMEESVSMIDFLRTIPTLKKYKIAALRRSYLKKYFFKLFTYELRESVISVAGVKWVPIEIFYAGIAEARLNGIEI